MPRPFTPTASVDAHDAWNKGGVPLRERRPGRAPQTWMGVTTCASDGVGRRPVVGAARGNGRPAGSMGAHMVHLQETFSDVVKTDKTGLSKTAHTRWMISAFANFLPGSTIFRLA